MASPYQIRRPVQNVYLVRERDRRRMRELAVVLFGLLPIAMVLFGYTWLHVETLRTGYRITKLERQLEELDNQERLLRLDASSRTSPGEIEARAREELGMEEPPLERIVFVEAVP